MDRKLGVSPTRPGQLAALPPLSIARAPVLSRDAGGLPIPDSDPTGDERPMEAGVGVLQPPGTESEHPKVDPNGELSDEALVIPRDSIEDPVIRAGP